ncbi:tetratricopeptide repeat protein [Pseudonocardia sp. TMWB2A]|uniref:tetratricopeptide repeat protein n=1 Tax=Pseudonocardia sp. TMWB2A TaxID=687430 RepID=UPI00307E9F38
MFFPLLLLLQSPAALPSMDEVDFNECMRLASGDAQSGIVRANEWAQKGGGWRAKQCLGFSQFKAGNSAAALTAYEQAAQQATTAKAGDSGKLWVQAGNAALLAGQPPRAIDYLGNAITSGQLRGEALGEAHIDRARAYAAAGDMAKAKADLEQAHNLVPQDPLGWLLSATLARREGDLPRARNDIATAAKIAGGDPAIALEAGNIAISAGDKAGARKNWQAAIDLAQAGPEAATAQAHLAQLDAMDAKPAAPAATKTPQ